MDAVNQFEAGADALRSVLADYDTVTLVANNPQIRLDQLPATEDRRICVFLNTAVPLHSVDRFDQDCMILSGMSVKEVFSLKNHRVIGLDRIAPGCCKAVGVIRSRPYGGRPELKNWSGRWIELSPTGSWPYPPAKYPSTGFVALNHLLAGKPHAGKLELIGFTGRTSTRRRLNNAHNWVYEQLYIRLLTETGKVVLHGEQEAVAEIEMLRAAFPEASEAQFNHVIQRYATEELGSLKASMQGVIKILWPITTLAKRLHFG
jgi:hypothetical protein